MSRGSSKVKTAYPEMTPLAAGIRKHRHRIDCPECNYLTDSYFSPKGVLMNDELKVDFYAPGV